MSVRIVPLDRLDLRFRPRTWPFAAERRAEILAHFRDAQALKPALWNGRVLLLHAHGVGDGVLSGAYLESDFASFLAWRDWGFPDRSIRNAFGQAALQSSDGAFLLGVMGAHTANAGRIYFPSGTPEPADIVGDTVDLAGNVERELLEETGLGVEDVTIGRGWTAVFDGPRIALVRLVRSPQPAEVLRTRILRHLADESEPELADIRIVRSRRDVDPAAMPGVVTAFLDHVWAQGGS